MPNMKDKSKAIVIGLLDHTKDTDSQKSSLDEAKSLLNVYGIMDVAIMTQNASHRDGGTYIGSGKVQELAQIVQNEDISIIVINDDLKAGQLFTIKSLIAPQDECKIWDRTQLILQIFKKHASTAEAKLQIELAELNHRGPELSGAGISMSQQGGGIGTRGLGETQTEIMQRHWRREIKAIENKLDKLLQNRHQQMSHRKKSNIPTVSIIGYTNAGKTTLFNTLSNKKDKVRDALFATLDSSVSTIYLQNIGKEIFLSDTIGFIQDLPTMLIDAFKSTLMETINADILLHVIDSSDPNISIKIETVEAILESLGLETKQQVFVFNKADKISPTQQKELANNTNELHIFTSATNDVGLKDLVELIEQELLKKGLKRAKHLAYLDNL